MTTKCYKKTITEIIPNRIQEKQTHTKKTIQQYNRHTLEYKLALCLNKKRYQEIKIYKQSEGSGAKILQTFFMSNNIFHYYFNIGVNVLRDFFL